MSIIMLILMQINVLFYAYIYISHIYIAQKFKNFCSSSLWTCLHHMGILRSQNKITDFFVILA